MDLSSFDRNFTSDKCYQNSRAGLRMETSGYALNQEHRAVQLGETFMPCSYNAVFTQMHKSKMGIGSFKY